VIAMENARLITETREALEQQTATAEVLQVINSSPGDLAPVFDAILEKIHSLCVVSHGGLQLYDGETFRSVTTRGYPQTLVERLRQGSSPSPSHPMRRLLEGEPYVHIRDLAEVDDPTAKAVVQQAGIRTILFLALRRDATLLGMITAARDRVHPFAEKEIALLQNFAAQAVVAMENARLITETREALEQQTATATVLQVINSSPGDLAPVFDAMLDKATRLCDAAFGSLLIYDGQRFENVAVKNVPEAFAEFVKPGRVISFGPGTGPYRLLAGEAFVHVVDGQAEEAYRRGDPAQRALIELGGARSWVTAPLRRDDVLLGTITVFRQDVRPFSDKQIALLQNFAAQAVIAMENARLLTETREALEQQTATAEVLQVINSSPGDLAPVFDAILEKAHKLCGGAMGSLGIFEGETWRALVQRGYGEPLASKLRQPARGSDNPLLQELIDGAPLVHVADLAQLDHPIGHANVAAGIRTLLVVALRKDHALLGTISIARREPQPFSDKEIALLENFAAQAVIAMENVAAHYRDARGPGAADRDRRGVGRYQLLARQSRPRVRDNSGQSPHAVRRDPGELVSVRRRAFSRGGDPRLSGRLGSPVTPRGRPLRHDPAHG